MQQNCKVSVSLNFKICEKVKQKNSEKNILTKIFKKKKKKGHHPIFFGLSRRNRSRKSLLSDQKLKTKNVFFF